MPPLHITDRYTFDEANIRKTGDGYLVASPRVARTGIQLYRGSEVGMPQMDVVRVYRPPDEVFHKDSMHTFAYKPVTNDHPAKPVTADNWRDFSVGLVGGEVARDGEFIRVPMTVMDGRAVKDVEDGKSELSVGYTTELKWEKGITPDTREAYDAIQTSIRVNHIAIVDAARGGQKLKIGDSPAPDHSSSDAGAGHEGEDQMTDTLKKTIISVDGISCEMSDTSAQIVQKTLKDLSDKLNASTAQVTSLTADAAKVKADHDAAIAKLMAEHKTALDASTAKVAALEQQVKDATVTPQKLEQMVKDRAEMIGKAKAVIGDALVIDGKTDAEIRKQVVSHKMGDAAKDWTDDQVKIGFDTLTASVKVDASAVTDTANAFAGHRPGFNTNDGKAKMYAEADKKLSERWKGGKAA